MVVYERLVHAGSSGCLHAIYLDVGAERFQCKGNARDETATAYRYDNGFEVGQLFQHFEGYGALSGNHELVIEGVDKRVPVFVLQLYGFVVGIVIYAVYQAHLCPEALGSFYLRYGSSCRQAYQRFNAVFGGSEGYALRMVSCRAGNHAAGLLLVVEL